MNHQDKKCRYCKYYNNPDGNVKILYHDNICCVADDKFRKRLLVIYRNHFLKPLTQKEDIQMVLVAKKFGDIDPNKNKTINGHYIIQVIPKNDGGQKDKNEEKTAIQKDM